MPTLQIGDKSVQVDDSFLKLSPEQQNATVEEIAKSIGVSQPKDSGGILSTIGNDISGAYNSAVAGVKEAFSPSSETNKAYIESQRNAPLLDLSGPVSRLGTVAKGAVSALGIPGSVFAPVTQEGGKLFDAASPSFTPQETKVLADSGVHLRTGPEAVATALAAVAPKGVSPVGPRPLPLSQAPSIGDLEAAKTAAYNDPAITDLRLHGSVGPRIINQVKTELLNNKLDPINAPDVVKTVNNLGKARFSAPGTETQTILSGPGFHIAEDVAKPAPLEVADLDLTRQSLADVPVEQQRAAAIARKVLDNYLGNIPQADVLAGDAAAANAKLLEARGNNAAMERALEVQRAMHNADVQSGSTYSGGNLNNAMRQQLRPLLKAKKGQFRPDAAENGFIPKGMNEEEARQLARAVLGTKTGNVARGIGKAGPTGGAMGLGHFGLAMASGGKTIPLSVATILARMIGNASTARQMQILDQMIRMRSPVAEALAARNLAQASPTAKALAAAIAARAPKLAYPNVMVPAYADQNQ